MISSHARLFLGCQSEVLPSERCLVNIEAPNIVNWLRSRVTSEDEKVGLAENDCVTVSTTWSSSDDGHDHPLGSRVTVSQIKEIEIV